MHEIHKKALEKTRLTLEELAKVNGGTTHESWQVVHAIQANPNLEEDFEDALNDAFAAYGHDHDMTYVIEAASSVLSRKFGINAEISATEPNKYYLDGVPYNQGEVVGMIRKYK